MVAINSVGATALTILKAANAQTVAEPEASPINVIPHVNAVSSRLAPGVSDALLKIDALVNGKAAAAKGGSSAGGAVTLSRAREGLVESRMMKLSELPADQAQYLARFGADAAVRVDGVELSQADFEQTVLQFGMESWKDLPGFNDALANGTLKIQRASDVPEIGYESFDYDIYSGGNLLGGVGWGGINNKKLYFEIQAQGIRQAFGSIHGQEFYVTWPDASLAKSS
ncbi:hypothetical protein ACVIW2_004955 [Bradyrhizobium huanghuaihaiense]|uniref:Uncharacterized protein n=1 Tax=Bradyrhizobium huanghuaihaiense TaxID=990078 RepID=A0A562QVH5_9BRAD|nr:hypothetical protein [Bradyrhizobium huanghuaihaiense]TWI60240.1 hypothetical protein IQ16_07738 [Bradyrhizobium huanghuaihaiense]